MDQVPTTQKLTLALQLSPYINVLHKVLSRYPTGRNFIIPVPGIIIVNALRAPTLHTVPSTCESSGELSGSERVEGPGELSGSKSKTWVR